MVKVQEGSHNQKMITLPKELAKAMGFDKGDELKFSVKDEKTLELTEK